MPRIFIEVSEAGIAWSSYAALESARGVCALISDADEAKTTVNIRAFPALQQD
jgi:hypothetical protein